jgi:hypothetical protein
VGRHGRADRASGESRWAVTVVLTARPERAEGPSRSCRPGVCEEQAGRHAEPSGARQILRASELRILRLLSRIQDQVSGQFLKTVPAHSNNGLFGDSAAFEAILAHSHRGSRPPLDSVRTQFDGRVRRSPAGRRCPSRDSRPSSFACEAPRVSNAPSRERGVMGTE